MRLWLILCALSISVSSAPVPISFSNYDNADATIATPRSQGVVIHPGVQAGLITSLAAASAAGLSVIFAEYISSLHDRWRRKKIRLDDNLKEFEFERERELTDDDYRNSGLDIVLDLVDRYLDVHPDLTPQNEDGRLERPSGSRGGIGQVEEDVLSLGPGHPVEEEVVVIAPKEEEPQEPSPELPLPRLPGFPPLSEQPSSDEEMSGGLGNNKPVDELIQYESEGNSGAASQTESTNETEIEECYCQLHHPHTENQGEDRQ